MVEHFAPPRVGGGDLLYFALDKGVVFEFTILWGRGMGKNGLINRTQLP